MSYVLRVVAVVRSGLPRSEAGKPRLPSSAEVEGRIEILPGYAEALDGLEAFSHAFVISYFHLLPEDAKGLVKVKPRRHRREGVAPEDVPTVGVFATDSPARPNPIGLSLVEIVRREGNLLVVRGLTYTTARPCSTSSRTGRTTRRCDTMSPRGSPSTTRSASPCEAARGRSHEAPRGAFLMASF